MSADNTISVFFEKHHDRLDALFQSFQTLKRHDVAKAQEAFKEFKLGLQRHIVWEEDLLFPLWEEKTGMCDGGPTFVMRNEHRQIGEQLESIHHKVVEQNPAALVSTPKLAKKLPRVPTIEEMNTASDGGMLTASCDIKR